MAAGIGEASAILTVTQLGFSLSSKLAEFVGDYKEAGNLMKSLSDDIEGTSTSLQQLYELAKQNGLHNPKGAETAMNFTDRCNKTISEVRSILKLDNVPLDTFSKDQETEISRLDRLR